MSISAETIDVIYKLEEMHFQGRQCCQNYLEQIKYFKVDPFLKGIGVKERSKEVTMMFPL